MAGKIMRWNILFIMLILFSIINVAGAVSTPDINGDGKVNYVDLGMLGASYGLKSIDDGYNANTDLNGDGKVNYVDLGMLGAQYGVSSSLKENDADGDGYADKIDAFPHDDKYHLDSDDDGYADKIDAFPYDTKYHLDSDDDGYADKIDAFPHDGKYHSDSDDDGYPNEIDAFPFDGKYHSDSDGDGYADKIDEYPNDNKFHTTQTVEIEALFDDEKKYKSSLVVGRLFPVKYDIYYTVTVTNIDTIGGDFILDFYLNDYNKAIWKTTEKTYVDAGESHIFEIYYLDGQYFDNIDYYSATFDLSHNRTIKI